ncbi:unnamed protein product [[Candida] boidinii]|uniref:Unnamed protein product n=1 Tax=Candida boidinii TaxID=5477 RepID=A0A9W6T480_CANBO|nr:hypothetical protein B5S33_g167 [[Candida] boidinii]GME71943.1 unnamed protein product [[Candida] boidinii]
MKNSLKIFINLIYSNSNYKDYNLTNFKNNNNELNNLQRENLFIVLSNLKNSVELINPILDLKSLVDNFKTNIYLPKIIRFEPYKGYKSIQIFGNKIENLLKLERMKTVPTILHKSIIHLDSLINELDYDVNDNSNEDKFWVYHNLVDYNTVFKIRREANNLLRLNPRFNNPENGIMTKDDVKIYSKKIEDILNNLENWILISQKMKNDSTFNLIFHPIDEKDKHVESTEKAEKEIGGNEEDNNEKEDRNDDEDRNDKEDKNYKQEIEKEEEINEYIDDEKLKPEFSLNFCKILTLFELIKIYLIQLPNSLIPSTEIQNLNSIYSNSQNIETSIEIIKILEKNPLYFDSIICIITLLETILDKYKLIDINNNDIKDIKINDHPRLFKFLSKIFINSLIHPINSKKIELNNNRDLESNSSSNKTIFPPLVATVSSNSISSTTLTHNSLTKTTTTNSNISSNNISNIGGDDQYLLFFNPVYSVKLIKDLIRIKPELIKKSEEFRKFEKSEKKKKISRLPSVNNTTIVGSSSSSTTTNNNNNSRSVSESSEIQQETLKSGLPKSVENKETNDVDSEDVNSSITSTITSTVKDFEER